MEEELACNPDYTDIKLVATVYGDDDDTKSFQEAQGLLQAYPDLKGIISPTTVGIAATARYLSTSEYKGKVALTGLGLPNEMRPFVKDGTVDEFALWDPAQLGYVAAYAGKALNDGRSPARSVTRSPPVRWASAPSKRAASSSSVHRPCSTPRTSTTTTSDRSRGGASGFSSPRRRVASPHARSTARALHAVEPR